MALQIKCPLCSEMLSGADEDALVAAADHHGDTAHNGMHAPRFMIVSNAQKVD